MFFKFVEMMSYSSSEKVLEVLKEEFACMHAKQEAQSTLLEEVHVARGLMLMIESFWVSV